MKKWILNLFGGGAGWLIVLLVTIGLAFGGGLYLEYKDAIKDKDEAEKALKLERANNASLRITVSSLARTNKRRENADEQDGQDEGAINATTDSNRCTTSEPIVVALDGVRDEWNRRYTDLNDD